MANLTERERRCLVYLSDKMDADGEAIGRFVAPDGAKSPRGYTMIGNGEAWRMVLDRPALVTWVKRGKRPLFAITAAGRARLQDPNNAARVDGRGGSE